jgi:hypothetical protein
MLLLVTPIKAEISIVFPHIEASGTIPSSQAILDDSTRAVSLKDEGIRGSGWSTNPQKFRAPKVHFLLKNHQIPSSDTRSDKAKKKVMAFHTRVPGRWRQATLGVDLLRERHEFPEG